MADDNEFDHIVKNSERVLRLNDQYDSHNQCHVCVWNVRFRSGDRCKVFFGQYMEFISGRFTKQRKQFLQANDKLYEGVELPTKNIRSSTEH